jgi:hypothetical protein
MSSGIFYCVFSYISRIPDKVSQRLVLLAFSPLLLYRSADVQAWPCTIYSCLEVLEFLAYFSVLTCHY